MDQRDGYEPIHENWGAETGDEIDEVGDPPRIWDPELVRLYIATYFQHTFLYQLIVLHLFLLTILTIFKFLYTCMFVVHVRACT